MKRRKCVVCGKMFYPISDIQKYCSRECYRKGQYQIRKEAKRIEKIKPVAPVVPVSEGKLWDIRDPECQEVARFFKTIKPIF